MDKPLDIKVIAYQAIKDIPADKWDACVRSDSSDGRSIDPFTKYDFLLALEESKSTSPEAGWVPIHLVVTEGGDFIAVMPLYVKFNSMGEFIFDYSWAQEYEFMGESYYPKLLSAVPFTPATGQRFLVKPGYESIGFSALIQAMKSIIKGQSFSSAHINFCTSEEVEHGQEYGLLHRTGYQYRWTNPGYGDFDQFLNELSSRKRRNIRRERKNLQTFGGKIKLLNGDQIQEHHWDSFWLFYQETGMRKWGYPYLTREFFSIVGDSMADDILLILCEKDGYPIAGALNFIGRDKLFGRYWGCMEYQVFLHFELCYYQAMDYAIQHGLKYVEAGAGGHHKLARGYLPFKTHSLHWIGHQGFHQALENFLKKEEKLVLEEIEHLTLSGPFKKEY